MSERKNMLSVKDKIMIGIIIASCFILFLLIVSPFKTKTVSAIKNDYIMTRKVNVKTDGKYILLDSIAEKKGEYDFPCYTAWSYTASVDYKTGLNYIENKRKEKEAKKQAEILANKGLQNKIKKSSFPVLIKVYNKETDRWIDYRNIVIHGKEGIIID